MPRKIVPKKCSCGCGGITKGGYYLQGHDQKMLSAIISEVGSIRELHALVERSLKCKIKTQL